MDAHLIEGTQVTLNSFCGKIIRTVVKDFGDIVLVARREQYEADKRLGTPPISIGFKKSDVVNVEQKGSPQAGEILSKHEG